jgi:hypothetical protein
MRRITLGLMLLGIIVLGLATGPALWAAPGQNPARQTVPTKTPTLPPATETPSVPPTSNPPANSPTPVPTATLGVTPTGQISEPLLPLAGGLSLYASIGAAMLLGGTFVLLLATVGRPGRCEQCQSGQSGQSERGGK